MKRRIVLLGPPASGKGTQSKLLAMKFGLPEVSTGALLRAQASRGTPAGERAREYTSRGRFFPDEIALAAVREWMQTAGTAGWILDGFPRTLPQAVAFDREFCPPDLVFHLVLPAEEIRRRLTGRLTCGACGATFGGDVGDLAIGAPCPDCGGALARRADDSPEVLAERLVQHERGTAAVVTHYLRQGRLEEIDAARSRAEVHQSLCARMQENVSA